MELKELLGMTTSELEHHGVKGQKWGVRRKLNKVGPVVKSGTKTIVTKNKYGDKLTMEAKPSSAMAKFLSKYSKHIANATNNTNFYNLKDKNGNTIGDMQTFKESKKSLNVVWLTTNESVRGKGYATAAMKGVISSAKKQGLDKVTLEVPGSSPDARHIYEKLGFKAKNVISDENDIWGGLTAMELNLNKKQ